MPLWILVPKMPPYQGTCGLHGGLRAKTLGCHVEIRWSHGIIELLAREGLGCLAEFRATGNGSLSSIGSEMLSERPVDLTDHWVDVEDEFSFSI